MANSRQPQRTRTGYLSQPWCRRCSSRCKRRWSGMEASRAWIAWREGESASSSQGKRGRHSRGVMGKPPGKRYSPRRRATFPRLTAVWGKKSRKKVGGDGMARESSTSLGESKNGRRKTHMKVWGSEDAQEPHFWGRRLAIAPSGVTINRWPNVRGPIEGHVGKIGYGAYPTL